MQSLCKSIFVAAVIGVLSASCSCGEEVESFDLRQRLNDPIEYYVVLCARESDPWGAGHTFVVLIRKDKQRGKVNSTGFGFYPNADRVIVNLFVGRGKFSYESTRAASVEPRLLTHRLIFQVDHEAFEAAMATRDQWRSAGYDYNLLSRNCAHFGRAVCRALGLDVPPPNFGERPPQYVERLMSYDWGRPRIPERRQLRSDFVSTGNR